MKEAITIILTIVLTITLYISCSAKSAMDNSYIEVSDESYSMSYEMEFLTKNQ